MSGAEHDARDQLKREGAEGLGALFAAYRDRLRKALALRICAPMQGRIDPSDVIQETFLEAGQRLDEYLASPDVAPYVWIRFLTLQRLAILQRHHLKTKQRDARREVSIDQERPLLSQSSNLAAFIIDSGLTPSRAIQQAEMRGRLAQALDQMDETDREVLALRHFEQMSNQETAEALALTPGAASKRYYKALEKLRGTLIDLFGEWDGALP